MTRQIARGLLALLMIGVAAQAQALERVCDTQYEDCRSRILDLIRNENVRIDVAFWFMTDARYSNELVKKFQSGVPVRVLVDTQANNRHPENNTILQQLKNAGIPMRNRTSGGILHWKMMLFDGQNVVEFSKANYTGESYVPITPYVDYFDEAVYFSSDDALTNTFRTKYDDLWTNTTQFKNYANITTPTRAYGSGWTKVSWMNLPPGQDFLNRLVNRFNAETQEIDAIVYRATDDRPANAAIAAVGRGVAVRLISEPDQYRDPTKLRHAYNIDRMYMAGVQIKHRNHQGLLHEAAVVLRGLGEAVFGTSNWTVDSANSQFEHNLFYNPSLNRTLDTGGSFYQWFEDQFDRKWNNVNASNAYVPFRPLPPSNPEYSAPANGAAGVPLSATLKWDGGPWAWKYDIYFGTSSTPPLYASDVVVGTPTNNGALESYTIDNLAPGTTYYWRIVGKTMANQTNSGVTWSFTTAAGSGGDTGGSDIVLYPGKATVKSGNWAVVSDSTAAGGVRMHETNAGAAKVGAPLASPANYFEMSFNAQAGIPYHVWIRGKADSNNYNNDSVWVQFSNSVDSTGTPVWRIGTTSGTWMGIEDCSGCGLSGWGWQDNGYGLNVLGPNVYFASSGVQTIRIQQREDGISLDQIVLSPGTYLTSSPGATKNDTVILPEAGGVTSGDTPPSGNNEVVIHAKSVTTISGSWAKESDSTAADGVRLRNPDAGAAKLTTAYASPSNFFEKSFTADAGKPYHIWVRLKADNNSTANDSVFVQFSGSQTASGSAAWRIGTTSALPVSLQEGNGAPLHAWGWNDNSYGSIGTPIYFATSGTQTIRVQVREDGVSLDQIVISASKYLNTSPGTFTDDTTILPETGTASDPAPSAGINEVVLHARSAATVAGAWALEADASAAEGLKLRNPDAGAAKRTAASASPASYFEHTFAADGGKPYHLWLRMRADDDSYTNDSVFVQFSGSVTQTGSAAWRIGTTSALAVSLQDDNGAAISGWGWNDNAWAALGDPIYFNSAGTQRIRVQVREDGVSIDQIVLSAGKYVTSSPGALTDDTTILQETAN